MIYYHWFGENDPEKRDICAKWAARIIWPDGEKDLRYFGEQLCLAVFDDDELIAVMVYHNYEPDAGVIEISGAALTSGLRYWLTHDVLAEMYRYPFMELGVQMVVQRTPAENARLLRLLKRLGFSFYTIPRLRGRDKDEVICTLTDDFWQSNRLIPKEKHNGKAKGSKAA